MALLVPHTAIAQGTTPEIPSSDAVLEAHVSIEPVATTTLSVSDKIKLAATKYGIDESTALNVACAESQMGRQLHNLSGSSASGVYHFLNSSWILYGKHHWGTVEGRDKLNEDDSIELAMLVMKEEGTRPWLASKWSGYGGGWANKPVEKGLCD